ncbi:hypothetical protein L9F63_022902 [Diploptera punctata]|uniref:CHK kinase-like domain-containing protein n=1 Tax=Diploptera punctata TaxID=6984 RepID=A0AAD7ZLS7_DIPPU|nr:hypothetical protein L9F63_022902 [Diploptera punctata]
MEERTISTVPSWLSDGFLKMVISREDCNVDIISSKVETYSESETNKPCSTYRVTVESLTNGHKEKNSLLIKSTTDNSKINQNENSLTREINAYTLLVLPMQKILEKLQLQFAPKLYFARSGPDEVLVHEDLEATDYRQAVPSSGCDMKTCILVTRKLAQFHASSVVLNQTHPDVMTSFKFSTYSQESVERLQNVFPPVLRKLAKQVETWPEYRERFAVKLHNLANSAVDKICECVTTIKNDFNVLCHEELCLQNILFGYSEHAAEIDEVRFFNYGSVHWGSPVVDFYRFLHSCAAPDVLEWSQILAEEYYFVLEDTLNRLGYHQLCPSIAHFYNQLEKRVHFGLILGLVDRAIMLSDNYPIPCVENYADVEFSDRYKNVVKKILLVLQTKGWI